MDLIEAILARKSIRGYRPDPVPREVLERVLALASRSPSTMNTQPWQAVIVSGAPLALIKREITALLDAGTRSSPDIHLKPFQGIYRERQVELAIQIFTLMGIAREDRPKRAEWMRRGYRFFDAPAVLFIAVDAGLSEPYAMFDAGAFAQTFCLAALAHGLGTCIEDQGTMFPEVVRRHTGITQSSNVVMCIAVGYPDPAFPANRLASRRAPLPDFVTWCGF